MRISKTLIFLISVLALSVVLLIINIKSLPSVKYKIYGGMTPDLKNSELYEDMQSGKSFCFLGDSITVGTLANDTPWYQPLIPYIKGDIMTLAQAGWLSTELVEYSYYIQPADIYVVAIGINDVLFLENGEGAGSADNYVAVLQELSDIIDGISPGAKIYFIAPWPFVNFPESVNGYRTEFSNALCEWCNGSDRIAIDPYEPIMEVLNSEGTSRYMANDFHPNEPDGVGLFSYAVLEQEHLRRIGS